MVDVVVVGAGMAGLSCAVSLQGQGHSVVVLEKSRGLGGRVATRRVDGTRFDYGARYVDATGDQAHAILNQINREATGDPVMDGDRINGDRPAPLPEHSPFQPWPLKEFAAQDDGTYQLQPLATRYVPKAGMTAIAKYLAHSLTIQRQQRVQRLQPNADGGWDVYVESQPDCFIRARAVILAIPAPQVIPLLTPLQSEGLSPGILNALHSVQFDPCITVTAGYGEKTDLIHPVLGRDWDAVCFSEHQDVNWVGVNSRKYPDSSLSPILVVQSSAAFARRYIDDTDRQGVGDRLLNALNQLLQWSQTLPEWTHVHYWRYGFCTTPLAQSYILTQSPCLLGCVGDWCGGGQIDDALVSGDRLADGLRDLLA